MNYTEAIEIIQTKTNARAAIKRIDRMLYNPKTTSFEKNGLRKMKEKAKEDFKAAFAKCGHAGKVIFEYEEFNSRQINFTHK